MGTENVEIQLSEAEFKRIKSRVYEVAGISLSEAKRTMVTSRLSKLVKARGLASFDAYVNFLEQSRDPAHDQDFVNALTTNLTRFFREDHHFAHLGDHVGNLIATRPRMGAGGRPRLRIWSAGCSTGQEPYTIAVSLLDRFPELKRWDFRILATDIDTNVLRKAAEGVYAEADLAGLSKDRIGLFERPGDGTVRIPAAARSLISFKPLNLMESWPFKGPFDIIFCRNVVIYFDKPTQAKMFDRLGRILAPDGFMYIGHSENLGNGSTQFKLVGKTIYQSKNAPGARDAA